MRDAEAPVYPDEVWDAMRAHLGLPLHGPGWFHA